MRNQRKSSFFDAVNNFIRQTIITALILFAGVYCVVNAKFNIEYDGARIVQSVRDEAKPWLKKTLEGGIKIVKYITD